jgi:molybdate transport system permease protein
VTTEELLQPLLVSLRIAGAAMLVVVPAGTALGWVLAKRDFRARPLVQTLVAVPMTLPPVALGLVLLFALSPRFAFGRALAGVLGPLLLTWKAAALASAVMALPFMVRFAEQAFAGVPRRLEDVARTLGSSRFGVFRRVTLPLASRGLAYGAAFAFARALGEFGATAVVAGRIAGETETLALAIYGRIEMFRDRDALVLSLVSLALVLAVTAVAEIRLRRRSA